MTCIITCCKTKKELREKCAATPSAVWIEDPSIFNSRYFTAAEIPEGKIEFCTNHPKRSWFAQITRRAGKVIVS